MWMPTFFPGPTQGHAACSAAEALAAVLYAIVQTLKLCRALNMLPLGMVR